MFITCVAACASGPAGESGAPAHASVPAQSSAAQPGWPCLAGSSFHAVTLPTEPAQPVALLGRGTRWVVVSNESDEDLCSWLPLERTLVGMGYGVAMYDYAGDPQQDLTAVVGYLRAHAAGAVALVGASEGAKASIVVGAAMNPAPQAVVSLSAEAYLLGSPVAPASARLHCPALFVTAANDPYGATEATRGFFASAPTTVKSLLVVPGQAHGTALLTASKVHSAVLAYLSDHDR